MKKVSGFTLVEIMVALAVVAILSAMGLRGIQESGQQSRDAKRQADVRLIQSALELYKNKYGRYPEGCNTASDGYTGVNIWSGQRGSSYQCTDGGSDYIRGSSTRPFSNIFPSRLPVDPRVTNTTSGYVYRTNSSGSMYKFIAVRSVETSIVTGYGEFFENTTFRLCDSESNNDGAQGSYNPAQPLGRCGLVTAAQFGGQPDHCQTDNETFRTSYAAWGGIDSNLNANNRAIVSENIICSAP